MKLKTMLIVGVMVYFRTLAMDQASQSGQSQNTAINPSISVGNQGATTVIVVHKLLRGYEEWKWDGLKLVYSLEDESPN